MGNAAGVASSALAHAVLLACLADLGAQLYLLECRNNQAFTESGFLHVGTPLVGILYAWLDQVFEGTSCYSNYLTFCDIKQWAGFRAHLQDSDTHLIPVAGLLSSIETRRTPQPMGLRWLPGNEGSAPQIAW